MRNNPRRQKAFGGGRAYSIRRAQAGIAANTTPETIERGGYHITVKRCPFWRAMAHTGAPFGVVDAYGNSREDAIQKLLAKIDELKARRVA